MYIFFNFSIKYDKKWMAKFLFYYIPFIFDYRNNLSFVSFKYWEIFCFYSIFLSIENEFYKVDYLPLILRWSEKKRLFVFLYVCIYVFISFIFIIYFLNWFSLLKESICISFWLGKWVSFQNVSHIGVELSFSQ